MIVKSKRIRARGQGLARALRHLMDGEDNDAVELVSGTVADLADARSDALRFGRQYAARHWIVSPGQRISREQLAEFANWLALEFGFDPARAVIWRHTKPRATEDGCDEHYHICIGEVDPITGGVMSSSHDWARHEKLARRAEMTWGHMVVPGPHMAAVVAALDRDGDDTLSALRNVAPVVPRQSFDEISHQRLKREGYDLPRLRVMISDALSASTSRQEFDAKLASVGLRLREGDKPDIPIVEAADSRILIGSLARLTRIRKAALVERLKFNAPEQPTQTEHSRSDVFSTQAAVEANRPCVEASGRRSESTRSNRNNDQVTGGNGPGRGSDPRTPGTAGIPTQPTAAAALMLRAGCHRQHTRLLDLLSIARRAAMSPSERVDVELHERIESEKAILNQSGDLPEPSSLLAARRAVDKVTARLREIECRSAELAGKIEGLPEPTFWNRLMGSSFEVEQQQLQSKSEAVFAKIRTARSELASAKHVLSTEQTKFAQECTHHRAELTARQQRAMKFIKIGGVARIRLTRNPELGFAGLAHLLRLATLPRGRLVTLAGDEHGELGGCDDVVLHDEWGKPYKPNPQASW